MDKTKQWLKNNEAHKINDKKVLEISQYVYLKDALKLVSEVAHSKLSTAKKSAVDKAYTPLKKATAYFQQN